MSHKTLLHYKWIEITDEACCVLEFVLHSDIITKLLIADSSISVILYNEAPSFEAFKFDVVGTKFSGSLFLPPYLFKPVYKASI